MLIIQVSIHVKPDQLEAFQAATLENARASRREPGIARFDVLQQVDDPTRFILVEVYRTPEDPARHKETAHYNQWRQQAEPLMAEARTRMVYTNLFPSDEDW
jgi:autoinducer 2-degrading protein